MAYAHGVSPVALATLRGVAGCVLVLGVAFVCGALRGLPRRAVLGTVCVGGPLFGTQLLCYFAAIESMGAQRAVVLVHVYPLLVVGLVWLRTRGGVDRRTVPLLAGTVVGVALVAGTGGGLTGPGVAFACASATSYALYVVLGESWIRQIDPLAAGGLVTVGATVTTGLVALGTGQSLAVTSSAGWLAVLVQGLLVVPIGLGGAFLALKVLGPVSASLLAMLEPVVGVSVAAVVLGERLAPVQWVGGALVVLACGLMPLTHIGAASRWNRWRDLGRCRRGAAQDAMPRVRE